MAIRGCCWHPVLDTMYFALRCLQHGGDVQTSWLEPGRQEYGIASVSEGWSHLSTCGRVSCLVACLSLISVGTSPFFIINICLHIRDFQQLHPYLYWRFLCSLCSWKQRSATQIRLETWCLRSHEKKKCVNDVTETLTKLSYKTLQNKMWDPNPCNYAIFSDMEK